MQTIVYKCPGIHKAPKGKTYSYLGVTTEEQYNQLISQGWFPSLDEAVSGKIGDANGDSEVDKQEAIDLAETVGADIDRRWSAERILAAAQAKLDENVQAEADELD